MEKISDKLSVAFQSAVLHEDTAQSALDKIAPELDALSCMVRHHNSRKMKQISTGFLPVEIVYSGR